LGSFLITETMERCPDMGFDSYDRFFPSQDTMPAGGFGNLIALPLQNAARRNGNSVFVDDDFQPYDDQWAFLASVRRMTRAAVTVLIEQAAASTCRPSLNCAGYFRRSPTMCWRGSVHGR
jgi:hypothetical protein